MAVRYQGFTNKIGQSALFDTGLEPGLDQTLEAVCSNGVLKPSGKLNLDEQQHARIIVEPIGASTGKLH
jgi:hypothetical protein